MHLFFQTHHREEREGELFLLLSALFNGLFPIVLHYATYISPPLFFAGISLVVASAPPILLIIFRRVRVPELTGDVLKHMFIVALFCLVIPTAFIAIGTTMTSGINTALLLQSEMLFTFLFFHIFLKEKSTREQIFGALFVFLGTVIILYSGSFSLNLGDLLIILGTAFYPIGNLSSKKIISTLHPMGILAFRSFFSGLFLLLLSFMVEGVLWQPVATTKELVGLILIQGIAVLFISKFFWYEGLERLPVGRSVFIGSSAPVFSLIFAASFLGENPTIIQLLGFLVSLLGLFFLTEKMTKKTLVGRESGL